MGRKKVHKYVNVEPTLKRINHFMESVSDEYLEALSEGDFLETSLILGETHKIHETLFAVVHESDGELKEGVRPLDLQQRRKRAMVMHRFASRLAAARKRLRLRRKNETKLLRIARKQAIMFLRQRVLKDRNYRDLSPSEKITVDKRLARIPDSVIDRIAKKLLPKVRQAETERMRTIFTVKEEFGDDPSQREIGTPELVKAYAIKMGMDLSGITEGAYQTISELFIAAPNDTLGFERQEMPQIGDTSEFLGFVDRSGVSHKLVNQSPIGLKATQREFNHDKIKGMMGYTGKFKEILVSRDGYVLDGHHRWLAAVNDGRDKIPTRVIDKDVGGALDLMKSYPKVFFKSLSEKLINRIIK